MKNIFKGKRVVIMGLGLFGGGVSAARFFVSLGANVLVTDLKTKNQLKESIGKLKGLPVKYVLGKHEKEDFKNADIIIKNPDVSNTSPYLEIARKSNISIETDISLFFKLSKAFIIGVTGTKGKSTTASLIYHILKPKYKRIFLAGNIGISALGLLPKIKKGDKVVLELSSFELEDLKQSPNIAVITNILPDHLNRYASMAEYIESKKIIFKYQKKNDILILNYDDPVVRNFAKESKSKVRFFSVKEKPAEIINNSKLFGEHNLSNILAAVSVAKALNVSESSIKKSVKSFKGVSGRLEFIAEIKGVKYFNDTTATMPDAVIEAIKTFKNRFPKSRLIFICGGQDKNLDFKKMAQEIKKDVDKLVLLPGTGSVKLIKNLGRSYKLFHASSMREAVRKAGGWAIEGDIVVLCPGAASFNLFKNEFDRGGKFIESVKLLKKNGK
jgi:UDP-N-acetylmuramoylalanine--D-glutamate ligase